MLLLHYTYYFMSFFIYYLSSISLCLFYLVLDLPQTGPIFN
jgi:hypothetical protein